MILKVLITDVFFIDTSIKDYLLQDYYLTTQLDLFYTGYRIVALKKAKPLV